MLKKVFGMFLAMIMTVSPLALSISVSASEEELSEYELKKNSFDPEYVMWTDKMIDEGFAALSPNQSNKESDGLSETKTPYGKTTDKNLTKWAEYEFLWTHGYPVGNGRMAAVVMGGIDKEVIQINEDTVWTGSPYVDLTTGEPTSGSQKEGWRYFRGANADGEPADIGATGAAITVGPESFQNEFPAFKNKSISNMALNVVNKSDNAAVQHRYDLISMVEKYFLGSPKSQKAYQSFVETYLDFGQKNSDVTNYTKALNMRDATVTVDYDCNGAHFTRETIASYPDQTIATNIKSTGELDFSAELHTFLENPVFEKVGESNNQIKVTAKVKDGKTNEVGGASKIKIEGRLYVEAPSSTVSVSEDNTKVIIKGGNEATVYVVGATNYVDYLTLDADKPNADCDKYISKIKNKNYNQIKTAHENDYKELFDRSYITLENDKAFKSEGISTEKRIRKDVNGQSGFTVGAGNKTADANNAKVYSTLNDGDNKIVTLDFNYGKYLMIAGSRDSDSSKDVPMSQPLNLTGKWNPSLSPSWGGKYTININTEMNYWLAQPLNLAECERPLLDVFKDLAKSGSITAKEQYGISNSRKDDSYQPGDPWVMHHNFDLWRGTQPIDNATAGVWPTGGIWLLDHAWQYYLYNKDSSYLSEFYPIMKGACEFFTQFLIVDSQTGYLVTAASCSPEQGSIQPGPAMDTQLIRNLYEQTIKAAEILGKETEDSVLLEKVKSQLPAGSYLADEKGKIAPNLIDKNGLIQEWARGDVGFDFSSSGQYNVTNPFTGANGTVGEHVASNNTGHRHCSHLWELYPGTHINAYSTDENEKDIFKAYQKSVAARGAGTGQGWGDAWRIALNARALDGNAAFDMVEQLIRTRTSPNMFGQHPNFQIDCNYGMTAGVVEMLLQSHTDTIDILPAIPDEWKEGQFKGFKARGNIEVGAKWKKGIPTRVDIKSVDGGEVKVRSPYIGTAVVKDSDGNEVASRLESDNNVIVFTAEEGKDYDIVGFGEIPKEEGTEEVTWIKPASETKGFFSEVMKDGAISLPKQENGGANVGYIRNDLSGKSLGFAYPNCELDGLKMISINLNGRQAGEHKVSIRIDSKDGEEIAQTTFGKCEYMYIDMPVTKELSGTHDLYVVFTGDKNAGGESWFVNVKDLKGTREVTFVNHDILTVYKDGEKYIKNSLSTGEYTFEVNLDKAEGIDKGIVIIACYDENNNLISATKTEVNKSNNKVNMTVSPENAKYNTKVMIWNNLDEMNPIRDIKEFV